MPIIERNRKYLIECKNIKEVISPKISAFRKFLSYLASSDMSFPSEGAIQRYIYTKYPLEQ